ncbi:M96 mating-specific protein family [Phytophthora palmivora]|uniref:M96 mating-specific protein family n=1 Tax=Phytophthora palmivora TaxID=4796 RepID=A0A2P4WVZ9_9STRA|nr:M96 mating-specific protein family [Phytophthora palmivora]
MEMIDVKSDKTATFYMQQIMRRYVEDQRVVIVWNAYIEPFTFDETRVHGVHFLLKGYVLMKPVKRSDSGETTTRALTCYNFMPHYLDPKLQKSSKTKALTKFVVSTTSSNISVTNDMVLVDEALQM